MPDAGAAKVATAAAAPTNYFELTFNADAGKAYRLWIHGRADNNYWANDSVFVQFSGSVTSSGAATYRIGTTSAAEVNLEECAELRGQRVDLAGQRLRRAASSARRSSSPRPDCRPFASRLVRTGSRSTRSSFPRRIS